MYIDLKEGDFFSPTEIRELPSDFEGMDEHRYDDINVEDVSEDEEIQDSWENDRTEEVEERLITSSLPKAKKVKHKKQQVIAGLNSWQARDEMISLRKRIWQETGEGPSAEGLLRKSMIDEFLRVLPPTTDLANKRMKWLLASVSDAQLPYLHDVCSITCRVEKNSSQ